MGRKRTIEKEPVTIRFKKLANGNKSIYLDIYRDGKRSYEFLKLYIVPETGRGKTEARRKNAETMAVANVIKAQRVLDMKNRVAGMKTGNGKMLLADWMDKYAEYKARISRSARAARDTVTSTKRQLMMYGGNAVKLKDIDKSFCKGFLDYLNNATSRYGKPFGNNTKVHYYTVFSEMLNYAANDGLIAQNPFREIDRHEKPKMTESNRVYLSIDEVRRLAQADCPVQIVKQAFMFSCFCGLRISDIRRLKWSDIKEETDENGNLRHRLVAVQKKTGRTVSCNLSAEAMKWLPAKGGTDTVFGDISSYVLGNIAIWAKAAGITKHVTFHTARHTFGTMMLTLGADLYTTSKLMGHTRIATTEIYAKIIDKKKDEAVGLIDKFFDNDRDAQKKW